MCKINKKIILIFFFILILFNVSFPGSKIEKDGIYYTKINIGYENSKKIFSTNYHKGNIIKVGTKVKITDFEDDEIEFIDENTEVSYTLINIKKHNDIKIDELFDHYFSKENVMVAENGNFIKFNKLEQENIQKGTIAVGMSKNAVIMAFGYPPKHKTASLKIDSWTYWESRFDKTIVIFNNDIVSNIKR